MIVSDSTSTISVAVKNALRIYQLGGLGEVGRDIAQGNQNLSSRTLQAVANLEQTAAAMAAMRTWLSWARA